MSDVAYPKHDFGPEELREIAVAFENCCAAMPQARSREFRELLAAQLIGWAAFDKVESVHLYLRALETYRMGPAQL